MSKQNNSKTEVENFYAENCPADAVREYIEKVIKHKKENATKEKEIPEEIIFSPQNIKFLLDSKYVDYIGAGETGNEIQFYWKKTEELPALLVKVARMEDGKFILTYIKEDATEKKPEFIWDKSAKEGKKGTIVVSKRDDALEDIYDMDR